MYRQVGGCFYKTVDEVNRTPSRHHCSRHLKERSRAPNYTHWQVSGGDLAGTYRVNDSTYVLYYDTVYTDTAIDDIKKTQGETRGLQKIEIDLTRTFKVQCMMRVISTMLLLNYYSI